MTRLIMLIQFEIRAIQQLLDYGPLKALRDIDAFLDTVWQENNFDRYKTKFTKELHHDQR